MSADQMRESVRDAIAEALGNAYDCTRVWNAWSYGTMGPDDFTLVREDSDRLDEIADAALQAMARTAEQPAQGEAVVRATVIKRGADRTWMSERMGELPDGTYSLYTAQPAPPLPDAVARKVAIAEWVAQNSWWTYSAANEAVTKAERLAAAPEPNRG